MLINILGTTYTYEEHDPFHFIDNCDGYCKPYDKEICIKKKEYLAGDSDEAKFKRYVHVITHELVHAFMEESGRAYEDDELLTDWIATMVPNINSTVNAILTNYNSDNNSNNKQQSFSYNTRNKKCPTRLTNYFSK